MPRDTIPLVMSDLLKFIGGAAIIVVVGVSFRGSKKTRLAKRPTSSASSPFLDKGCRYLGNKKRVSSWYRKHGQPLVDQAVQDNPIYAGDSLGVQHAKLTEYTRAAISSLPVECNPVEDSQARMNLYKVVWCNIATSMAGILDEEPEALMFACMDPEWSPLEG